VIRIGTTFRYQAEFALRGISAIRSSYGKRKYAT